MRDTFGDALSDLHLLVSTVRAGGVRAAAERLGVPRSTVSRRLAELQERLGVALVRAGKPGIALTEVGAEYFDRLAEAVDGAESLVEAVSGRAQRVRGTLRVAASSAFAEAYLAPVLTRYAQDHPEVRVEVHLAVDRIDLRRAQIDVAFRTSPLPDDDDLTALRLGESVNGFYAAPAYLARRGTPAAPADLAGHDALFTGAPERAAAWRYADGGQERALPVMARVVSQSFRLTVSLASAGAGICRVPTILAEDHVAAGDLVPLLRPHWPRSTVHAVFPRGLASSAKTRAFLELARRDLVPRLGGRAAPPQQPRPPAAPPPTARAARAPAPDRARRAGGSPSRR